MKKRHAAAMSAAVTGTAIALALSAAAGAVCALDIAEGLLPRPVAAAPSMSGMLEHPAMTGVAVTNSGSTPEVITAVDFRFVALGDPEASTNGARVSTLFLASDVTCQDGVHGTHGVVGAVIMPHQPAYVCGQVSYPAAGHRALGLDATITTSSSSSRLTCAFGFYN